MQKLAKFAPHPILFTKEIYNARARGVSFKPRECGARASHFVRLTAYCSLPPFWGLAIIPGEYSVSSTAATFAHDWPFAIYLLSVAGLCGLMLIVSYVAGGRDWGRAKNQPFESGVVSTGGAHVRFSAKFYLVAMFFVIFDVEALFLFAWAVSVRESGWAGFIEVTIFVVVLLVGLIYLWRLGALDWAPEARKRRELKRAQASSDRRIQARS